MGDALRRVGLLAAPLLIAGLLAGCSDDEPTLLDSEALPSAVESSSTGDAGFPGVSNCHQLVTRQAAIGTDAWASGGYQYWIYSLDSGDAVSAAVLAFDDRAGVDAALEQLEDAIAECAAEEGEVEVTVAQDLPDGVGGYRASEPLNDTTKEGTLVYTTTDDHRIVAVGVSREDGTAPTVDVLDLLERAEERAADLDDLPTKEDRLEEG